ncbi:MAG: hypothetical protein ACI4XG_15170, partial [Bradyrhizobium sp.]
MAGCIDAARAEIPVAGDRDVALVDVEARIDQIDLGPHVHVGEACAARSRRHGKVLDEARQRVLIEPDVIGIRRRDDEYRACRERRLRRRRHDRVAVLISRIAELIGAR